jgi:hypothetical protein
MVVRIPIGAPGCRSPERLELRGIGSHATKGGNKSVQRTDKHGGAAVTVDGTFLGEDHWQTLLKYMSSKMMWRLGRLSVLSSGFVPHSLF